MIQEEEEWTQNRLMGTLTKQKRALLRGVPFIEGFFISGD
jgi:hypothetical protein